MNKILLILFSLTIISCKGYSQWVHQIAPSGTTNINSVFAIDTADVACAANLIIPRTTDGGTTWLSQVVIGGANFSCIHTQDTAHWYSLTSSSTWFAKVGNPIGVTLSNGKPDSILSIHFRTPSCAVAVGLKGKTVISCDSGVIWTSITPITSFNLNSIWFADSLIGVACGNSGKGNF